MKRILGWGLLIVIGFIIGQFLFGPAFFVVLFVIGMICIGANMANGR